VTSEQAENFGRPVAGAAEPVRHLGVELGHLSRAQHQIVVPEDELHPAGENVEPLLALMRAWLGVDLRGRDDDLPRLHPVGL
jgi:hypothetical protein